MTREGETFRAVRANLVSMAGAPTATDYRVLHDLVLAHGSVKIARIHRDVVAEIDDRAGALGTRALTALADSGRVRALLVADPAHRRRAVELAETAFRQGCMLVLAGLDPDRPGARARAAAPPPAIPIGFDLGHWREVLAPLAAAPWSPYGDRLVKRAAAVGADAVRIVAGCRALCQEAESRRERLAIAGEIRRLVAETGLSQREFAPYVGTSASRLSTYATGRVVPSAAMMLRIQHVARTMPLRAAPPLVSGVRTAS